MSHPRGCVTRVRDARSPVSLEAKTRGGRGGSEVRGKKNVRLFPISCDISITRARNRGPPLSRDHSGDKSVTRSFRTYSPSRPLAPPRRPLPRSRAIRPESRRVKVRSRFKNNNESCRRAKRRRGMAGEGDGRKKERESA